MVTEPVNTAVDYSYAYVLSPVHSMDSADSGNTVHVQRESHVTILDLLNTKCARPGGGVKGAYTRLRLPKGCIAHVGHVRG